MTKCNCKLCWQGYEREECPLRRLENERLMLSAVLIISIIGILVLAW